MTKQSKCSICLFGDKCVSSLDCDFYSPIDDDNDEYIDELIETRRREFEEEWEEYANQYSC